MDIQKLMDAMNDTASRERANYHLTLGNLVAALEASAPDALVEYDTGRSPSAPQSYRGYYCDLSFPPSSEPMTAKDMLKHATRAIGETFEGYKGGDFTMHAATPLWASPYGDNNGVAITGHRRDGDKFILVTKQIG